VAEHVEEQAPHTILSSLFAAQGLNHQGLRVWKMLSHRALA
jgi:hypothetical protein